MGEIKRGVVPKKIKKLFIIKSGTIKDAVFMMNKASNNVIAETLNKLMGVIFDSLPGAREKGLKMIRRFLVEKIGLERGSFVIKDASGLSVENRFSPRQFISILNYFYKNIKIKDVLISSIDFRSNYSELFNSLVPDNIGVYAKSGTLANLGVNTLAGYIIIDKIDKKEAFSFVIFANKKILENLFIPVFLPILY